MAAILTSELRRREAEERAAGLETPSLPRMPRSGKGGASERRMRCWWIMRPRLRLSRTRAHALQNRRLGVTLHWIESHSDLGAAGRAYAELILLSEHNVPHYVLLSATRGVHHFPLL